MNTNNNNHKKSDDDIIIAIEDDEEDQKQTGVKQEQNISQNVEGQNNSEIVNQNIKAMIFDKLGVANSTNPIICILHLFFKAAAILTYLFGGLLFNSITIFIFVAIFGVLDFWVVKNLSGRILAGLRWWRIIDENGNEKWIFESHDDEVQTNKIDSVFFWYGQIVVTLFWIFMTFIKLITFNFFWVILAGSSFGLTATNLYAFYRCRKDYKNKIQNLLGNGEGAMNMSNVVLGGIRQRLGF